MQQRLTVAHFYQPFTLTCAIEIQNLEKAYFVEDSLFVTTKDAPIILQEYSLKSKLKTRQILLPFEGIAGVAMLADILCLYFACHQDLWVLVGDKLTALKSHFLPISSLSAHKGSIYTGSLDMTIRVWNRRNETLIQDPQLHALSAHTGAVNCLFSLQKLLLSTSSDKSVIAWKGSSIFAKKEFPSEVKMIAECSESRQLAFLEQNGTICIINSYMLAQERRMQISRIIKEVISEPVVGLHEMDDSFLEIILPSHLNIAEINLGVVMADVKMGEKIEVVSSKCLRRMTLLAVEARGLFTLAF